MQRVRFQVRLNTALVLIPMELNHLLSPVVKMQPFRLLYAQRPFELWVSLQCELATEGEHDIHEALLIELQRPLEPVLAYAQDHPVLAHVAQELPLAKPDERVQELFLLLPHLSGRSLEEAIGFLAGERDHEREPEDPPGDVECLLAAELVLMGILVELVLELVLPDRRHPLLVE